MPEIGHLAQNAVVFSTFLYNKMAAQGNTGKSKMVLPLPLRQHHFALSFQHKRSQDLGAQ